MRRSGAQELIDALTGRVEEQVGSMVLAAGRGGHDGSVAYVAGTDPEALQMRQSDVLTAGQEHLDGERRLHLASVRAIEHDMETSNLPNPLGSLSGGDRQKATVVAVAESSWSPGARPWSCSRPT